jgi:hypothetical protein
VNFTPQFNVIGLNLVTHVEMEVHANVENLINSTIKGVLRDYKCRLKATKKRKRRRLENGLRLKDLIFWIKRSFAEKIMRS